MEQIPQALSLPTGSQEETDFQHTNQPQTNPATQVGARKGFYDLSVDEEPGKGYHCVFCGRKGFVTKIVPVVWYSWVLFHKDLRPRCRTVGTSRTRNY